MWDAPSMVGGLHVCMHHKVHVRALKRARLVNPMNQRKLESPDQIKPGNVPGNIRIFFGSFWALGAFGFGSGPPWGFRKWSNDLLGCLGARVMTKKPF